MLRHATGGAVEVLLVHRPAYDDWTLPKGKADPGESDEDCARREVWEETGLRCALGPELPGATYEDRGGRTKRVRYWEMTALADPAAHTAFVANDEIDALAWLPLAEAHARLTYNRDRDVLAALGRPS